MEKRNTKQKAAIRDAFMHAGRPLSTEEALAAAKEHHPGVGIATVYRNIEGLVEEHWLNVVEVPGDSTRYEIAGKGHHHHFQCNSCGKVYDLKGCIEQTKPKIPRGFKTTGHEFFFYGNCASCNLGASSRP